MSDILLRHKLSRHRELRVSELSHATLADQGSDSWLSAKTGLFLYVLDERPVVGGITVLAHFPSPDAAFMLFDSVLAELTQKVTKRKAPLRTKAKARTGLVYA